jgi:hypothetical protein
LTTTTRPPLIVRLLGRLVCHVMPTRAARLAFDLGRVVEARHHAEHLPRSPYPLEWARLQVRAREAAYEARWGRRPS